MRPNRVMLLNAQKAKIGMLKPTQNFTAKKSGLVRSFSVNHTNKSKAISANPTNGQRIIK
jgi:hypothetical protein